MCLYTRIEFGVPSLCCFTPKPKYFYRKYPLGDHFALLLEELLMFYYSGGHKQQVIIHQYLLLKNRDCGLH